jgi:Cd2+/Zn2+-exporting ATPase
MGRLSFALLGGCFTLNSFLLDKFLPNYELASEYSALAGAVILAMPIIWTAIKDLWKGKVYMNELVALAILAAIAGGDFQTAGLIAFFLLLTIIIETRTASGAQRSIEELIKLTPSTAHVVRGGVESDIEATDLLVGDIVRVRAGDNFPVDGTIIKGESTVNQASITGESVPVDKAVGEDVYAGTQNLTGGVEIRVTKVGEDTTLGKVKEMILAAEGSKTPIVRIIDRYASYYTPAVLMLAAVTWWFSHGNMSQVITLMVIACPCAVVLATPTAVVAAVAAAARLGILIKNVAHLELASKIRTFVFDKTGTLTNGLLSVVRLNPFEGTEPAELLSVAASAEQYSNHPTGKAMQRLAAEAELNMLETADFEEIHGKGVSATVAGRKCQIGRASWLETLGFAIPAETEETANMSIVYVACEGKLIGWIGLRDKLRDEAPQMIANLRELGIRHCAMVTGDRESVAEAVAAQIHIDEYRSECLPEGKVEFVKNASKNSIVAVVGDGVNDAPALAAGDLGIAMGAIGSDVAINSASIALMTNDLRRIPALVSLSRKMCVIMNQNVFVGFLFVVGGMIMALLGLLTPVAAAVLHTLSTILIIFNSARLVRSGEEITLDRSPEQL